MKALLGISGSPRPHWVGDGFPVRSLFSFDAHGRHVSPFLLADYAGPHHFPPAATPRGMGEHPHRGFETVTIAYQGELEHRDSSGQGGRIGPGDVQWMTAGAGILHEEFHSEAFTSAGGVLEMLQLWVNLPARHKGVAPGYQAITDAEIPALRLPDAAGRLQLIAGAHGGQHGPARSFTPLNVWDLRLNAGGRVTLPVPDGHNTILLVLRGKVRVNGTATATNADMALLSRDGTGVMLEAVTDAVVLLLSGEPIDESIDARGPFVMNTTAEVVQAYADYRESRFGRIAI